MAKNSSGTNRKVNMVSNYDQQQANIRKAKGNPNKNVHQKKNGSNYKGYAASKLEEQAEKLEKQRAKNSLPKWVIITMAIIFAVLVAILVLMNTTFKDNLLFGQISTILIGVSCGILFYMRNYTKNPDSKFQNILYTVLAVMAVVMIAMGCYGLFQLL